MTTTKSTIVKTKKEILEIRRLSEEGISNRKIAKEKGFTRNTIKKIINKVDGYEGNEFNHIERWKNVGKLHSCPKFISKIDDEVLYLQSATPEGYIRVNVRGERKALHIYEAKKLYKIIGIEWIDTNIVHHKDYDKANYSLSNLSVFQSIGLHKVHHSNMENSMYIFLKKEGLLDKFYIENPNMKVVSLNDMLIQKRKQIKESLH